MYTTAKLFSPHLEFFGGMTQIAHEAIRGCIMLDEANMCPRSRLSHRTSSWRTSESPISISRIGLACALSLCMVCLCMRRMHIRRWMRNLCLALVCLCMANGTLELHHCTCSHVPSCSFVCPRPRKRMAGFAQGARLKTVTLPTVLLFVAHATTHEVASHSSVPRCSRDQGIS